MTEHSLWPRRTPRLELRIPSLDDLDQVLTWRNDPAVTRWMLSTTVDPDSWRVMEKCGMRREQHGVQDSWHAELGWVDGYTYAILAEDWRDRLVADASAQRSG